MSGNVITLKQPTGDITPNKDEEPTPINTRLRWLANLVQILLDAETTKHLSSTGTRPLDT
jgi:hypothetical protein